MGSLVEFPSPETTPRVEKPLWRHVLGEVLRGERLEQERILTEVAATAGVSPQYLSEVERGRKEASSEVLGAVAEALGLDLVDVVGRVAGRLAARAPERRTVDLRQVHSRVDAIDAVRDLTPSAVPPSGLAAPVGPAPSTGLLADAFLLAA